ncbi:heme oxygenase [Winogradskyella sp. J14-2]|uniref:DUF3050 domain-containing protein n=1 Tax=Winogradskyella sp. J14-2 TaxID=1936080 RepID=UPI000972DD52|nr:DUF3050 domain-containing protein [Winogradskyella sp. J14-2]APY07853.1 heme oxygenase [Winogradskyella sp. J14-2]
MDLKNIEQDLSLLREELNNHKLYGALSTVDDIKTFMQQHVFAVWDFMSLLKALQNNLTHTSLPWLPVANPHIARFINEIVLDEESDVNELGEPMSHFEMYLDAMRQIGADTNSIESFLIKIANGEAITTALDALDLNAETVDFVKFTFSIIASKEAHKIAAAFTFGREDVIPDMFFQIINQSKTKEDIFSKLSYYLNRHIELDGDEHGPLALKMIEALCGNDSKKIREVSEVSKLALQYRIALWDGIYNTIIQHKAIEEVS